MNPSSELVLTTAGRYPTYQEGFEHGLVVLAMGHPCWLTADEAGGFRLEVEPEVMADASEQLARFDRESAHWPPPEPPAPAPRQAEWITPLIWAVLVLAAYQGQLRSPGRWEQWGELNPPAIFQRGEFWRPFTALFLHGDFGHLLSNLLFGIFTFSAVLTTLGRGRGWLLLALAAGAGNLAAAAVNYSAPYRSLGASTAIFAGLGLLTGHAIRSLLRGNSWRRLFAPLAAGFSLLALYGAGGLNVDVLAHAGGFAAGLILGFASPPAADHRIRP